MSVISPPTNSRVLRAAALCLAVLLAAAVPLAGCGTGKTDATADAPTTTPAGAKPLPGTGKPLVVIGDKNYTEQFLLGELYSQALTAQGFSVQLNRDIGPTEVTLPALYSGRLGMYPEYLSTWNSTVAGYKHHFRTTAAAVAAARRFAARRNLSILNPTPFSDTSGLATTVSYASAQGLRGIGDLRKVAQNLTLGAPPQFQQDTPGLGALEIAYGFVPVSFKPLALGDQYHALDKGTVQAAYVNTTDGELTSGSYTLLRDPKRVFGIGQAVPVVSDKVLQEEGPAFADTINRVTRLLTTSQMRQMNAAVDVYNRDPAVVAKQFLQAHGLVALKTSS
jgi:osmoprotectant transport system substrate-binding protein